MLYFIFPSILHLLFILDARNCEIIAPPKISGSFFATGETVSSVDGTSKVMAQDVFEETFDKEGDYAAVEYRFVGLKIRIVEDLTLDQTLMYSLGDNENKYSCKKITNADWIKMDIEPHLKQFEILKGRIVLPLRQLLTLTGKSDHKTVIYKGIPADLWKFTTKDNTKIDAYWSDGTWKTSSKYKAIPLGFTLTRTVAGKETVTHINVMEFQNDVVNEKLLEPIRGVYCEDRISPYEFPVSVNELQYFSYSTEFVFKDDKLVTSVDTWIDLAKMMMRTDYDPFGRDSQHHTFTEIVSMKQGVTYEISKDINTRCLTEKNASDPKDPKDVQIIFDYRDKTNWNGRGFFGLDKTNYSYIGETEERGIPCRLFQGMREDFPYGSKGFSTLWEWCLDKHFEGGSARAFPAISLNIYFKKVNSSMPPSLKVKEGNNLTYHFYNAQYAIIPISLHTFVFDIGFCFSDVHKRKAQVEIPVPEENRIDIQDATNDIFYVNMWFEKLTECSKTDASSMRINNFRLRLTETGPLYAFFTLLDKSTDLFIELTMEEIIDNIKTCVENKGLKVTRNIKTKDITLTADKFKVMDVKKIMLSPSHSEFKQELNQMKASEKPQKTRSESNVALWMFFVVGYVTLGLGLALGIGGMLLKRRLSTPTS